MKLRSFLVASAALTLVACGRGDERANVDTGNVALDNGLASEDSAAVSPTTAQGFANATAASDRFEIESSNLAATAGQSAAVKSFATKMVTAHTASSAKLKSAVAGLTPPVTINDALNPGQQQLLDSLKGKTGAEFDAAYAQAQVAAHQATLDMLDNYTASGDSQALKDLARGMLPTVTAHLNMAKGLK
jgi:putative membrane protein